MGSSISSAILCRLYGIPDIEAVNGREGKGTFSSVNRARVNLKALFSFPYFHVLIQEDLLHPRI
jgi:hypothetical protein